MQPGELRKLITKSIMDKTEWGEDWPCTQLLVNSVMSHICVWDQNRIQPKPAMLRLSDADLIAELQVRGYDITRQSAMQRAQVQKNRAFKVPRKRQSPYGAIPKPSKP